MTIFVNGARVDCGDAGTVDELVQHYDLSPEATLIEQNGVALQDVNGRREFCRRTIESKFCASRPAVNPSELG